MSKFAFPDQDKIIEHEIENYGDDLYGVQILGAAANAARKIMETTSASNIEATICLLLRYIISKETEKDAQND